MKNIFRSFVSLCAVYFLATGLVLAEPADVYILDGLCGVLDENGVGFGSPDTEGMLISANNANGNITLKCSFSQDRPSTGRSVIFNYDLTGGECGVGGGVTTKDWHQVISASGNTKLTCHYTAP